MAKKRDTDGRQWAKQARKERKRAKRHMAKAEKFQRRAEEQTVGRAAAQPAARAN
jgi:hypothetical protein